VVVQKDNPIVKWDDEPSGLKDDWTLYYKSVTCQDVHTVALPIYKQLDEMEYDLLFPPHQNNESSSNDAPSSDDESKERDDDYNERGDALAAGVVTARDDSHYQQHLSDCEADDAMGSKEKDADRMFGFFRKIPF
jgi:hypothetical protein